MASYTNSLRLTLPVTGTDDGTWGDTVNNGITTLVDTSIAGTAAITMIAADYTLTSNSGATDEARSMFITLGGTPGAARNVICPTKSKLYFVKNNTAFAQTFKTLAGTGITVPNSGTIMVLYCDGTNVVDAITRLSSLTLGSALLAVSGGTGLTAPGTSGNVLTSNGITWSSVAGAVGDVTLGGVQTLTNKRIDPRVSTAASAASITPDVASFDQYCLTAQAAALAINAPTGTPVNGNKLIFRFLDNGTARALTWNATYTVIGVTLPTTTTINKMLYVGCIYNAANTRWDVIAVTTQA
jgi:hypothetical protein